MKFAKIVFWTAGIWGVLILTPLFFIYDTIGRNDPPPVTHPGFYYGFACVGLAFQFVFMIIASDPMRFRPLMIASMFEKFSYFTAAAALHFQGRMHTADLALAAIDFILGLLFIAAYIKTRVSP